MEISAEAAPQPAKRGAIGLGTWSTQAEYKDIKVTSGGKVLAECDFAKGNRGLEARQRPVGGRGRGVPAERGDETDIRSIFGDTNWSEYTLTLKARKLGGAEGFLIMFHVLDEEQLRVVEHRRLGQQPPRHRSGARRRQVQPRRRRGGKDRDRPMV